MPPCLLMQSARGRSGGKRQLLSGVAPVRRQTPAKTDPKSGSVCNTIDWNCVSKLARLIKRPATENRASCAIGKRLQRQSALGIESEGKSQAAGFAQPEKHWAPAHFGVASIRGDVGRLVTRQRLECKQLAVS